MKRRTFLGSLLGLFLAPGLLLKALSKARPKSPIWLIDWSDIELGEGPTLSSDEATRFIRHYGPNETVPENSLTSARFHELTPDDILKLAETEIEISKKLSLT